jgi:histidine triad (HIT) family protein
MTAVPSHPGDPKCIFCKILRGDIPSSKVLEDDHAVAILDIHPVNLGHILLIPKEHHADLTELTDAAAAQTAALLPRLCRAVRSATGADGFNVIVNNGRAAGQTVDHGHWHIIPRFHNDPVNWPWPHSEYMGDALPQMQFRIQRELEAEHSGD